MEDPSWRRSSFCANGACVEVAQIGDQILVRDSQSPHTAPLIFDRDEWAAFVQGVRAGEFDQQ